MVITHKILLGSVLGGFMAIAASAHADGFIASIVKPFNPEAARNLDKWHAAAGKPIEHAANAAAGAAVTTATGNPGAGAAVTGLLEVRTNTPR